MSKESLLKWGGVALAALAIGWALFVWLPRRYTHPTPQPSAAAQPMAAAEAVRRIKARLFYVSPSGRLTSTEQEVAYGEGTLEQARRILEAQFGPAPAPLMSAIPAGTKLKTIFVSDRGEAFVDLSREIQAGHPGGSLNEIATVFTVVNALTVNLPALTAVQILVEGREVETLAGHVDLRRPIQQDLQWVEDLNTGTTEPANR